jgi:putative ABC transport system permease protein
MRRLAGVLDSRASRHARRPDGGTAARVNASGPQDNRGEAVRKLRALAQRVLGLFRKEPRERELADELASNLELHIEENIRRGMTPEEARRQARIRLGGIEMTKQLYRDQRGLPFLETLLQDVRFGTRMLWKNRGFTVVAVLVMALGIGANTAVFSVVNAVLLRPLAFNDPDRLVTLSSLWLKDGHHGAVSMPDFQDWHDQSTAFEAMANFRGYEIPVSVSYSAENVFTTRVGPEFFRVFRIAPIVGREFTSEEAKPGGTGAVILSSSYAENHFGSATAALGRTLRLSDKTLDIVGVMPRGFHFPEKTDIWYPSYSFMLQTATRSGHNDQVVGRLKDGVTLEQGQAQMTAIGTRLSEKYPDSNQGKNVAVTRVRDEMVHNFRLTLWVMLAAVGVVLLIACANLANMLLAKAVARTREIAIRAAIGASRTRIVRQLATESTLLALLSGAVGLLISLWGAHVLVALAPGDVPRLSETGLDFRVLVFAFGASLFASLLFGLAPALQALRVDLNKSLKQTSTRTAGGTVADRLRSALVVSEIALSVVLLAGAGLLLKSFIALQNVSLGFSPERVLVMAANVPSTDLESAKRATRFYKNLLDDVRTLPGVLSVGATLAPPGDTGSDGGYWIDFLPEELNISAPQAVFSVEAPGVFATLGTPLISGRDFSDSDTYDAPFVAIINEALVKQSFAGQDPLGRVIYCGLDSSKPMRIIGVVANIRQYGPGRPPSPQIYMAYQQHPQPATDLSVLVRTVSEPSVLAGAIRESVRRLSTDVPVKFTTMEESLHANVAAPRFRTLLLGIFAVLAVCLSMAGVYGVMSYVVGQRANEIGLRVALGASRSDVLRMVMRQSLTLTAVGVVLGLAGAAAATQLLTSMLFGIKPSDPLTYVATIGILIAVAAIASYIPARRAMQVDPMVALRYE